MNKISVTDEFVSGDFSVKYTYNVHSVGIRHLDHGYELVYTTDITGGDITRVVQMSNDERDSDIQALLKKYIMDDAKKLLYH